MYCAGVLVSTRPENYIANFLTHLSKNVTPADLGVVVSKTDILPTLSGLDYT